MKPSALTGNPCPHQAPKDPSHRAQLLCREFSCILGCDEQAQDQSDFELPGIFCCHAPWHSVQFSSVQSLSHVQLFVAPWTVACQASLSITNSRSLLKPMSIESVMPSNHLTLCRPLLLPSIFPSIRVFSNESVLRIRWPKYWSFSSASVLPMNI